MLRFALLVAVVALLSPAPAAAAPAGGPALFAGYWQGFVDHWTGVFGRQDSIIVIALAVGAAGIFIITRGKWLK